MLQIQTHTATSVPASLAALCAETLCKPGGEIRAMFHDLAGLEPESWAGTEIAIATLSDATGRVVPIGWATLTQWNGKPSFQASVFPTYRHRGLASAMLSAITVSSNLSLAEVSVFHPRLVRAAERSGFKNVQLWERSDDGWVRVQN